MKKLIFGMIVAMFMIGCGSKAKHATSLLPGNTFYVNSHAVYFSDAGTWIDTACSEGGTYVDLTPGNYQGTAQLTLTVVGICGGYAGEVFNFEYVLAP